VDLLQDLLFSMIWGTPGWLHRPSCAVPPFLRGGSLCDAIGCVGCCRMCWMCWMSIGGGFRCRSTSGSLAITRPKCDSICDAVGRCWFIVYTTKALESFSIDGIEYIRSSELLGSTYRKQTKQTQTFAYLLIICSSLILIKENFIYFPMFPSNPLAMQSSGLTYP